MQKQVEKKKYYVVRERAVPEVLLKVVEAKRLLESNRVATVQEAAERTGISRSSFYKYKDDIFPFHEETKGKTITFIIQMDDEPGLLSMVLQTIARFHGNILTIHQSIPINGVATLTLSVDILPGEGDAEAMVEDIEQREFTSTSGGGAVEVVVSGRKELKSINIKPEVVDKDDIEMLQDLIISAVNEAVKQVEDTNEKEMGAITGGISFPGLF